MLNPNSAHRQARIIVALAADRAFIELVATGQDARARYLATTFGANDARRPDDIHFLGVRIA